MNKLEKIANKTGKIFGEVGHNALLGACFGIGLGIATYEILAEQIVKLGKYTNQQLKEVKNYTSSLGKKTVKPIVHEYPIQFNLKEYQRNTNGGLK